MRYVITLIFVVLTALTVVGCAHTPTQTHSKKANQKKVVKKAKAERKIAAAPVKDNVEDSDGYSKQLIEKLEKENSELELQNTMLLKALNERKSAVQKLPKGQAVQHFPEFEELIFDQAKTAYREKDEERLQEAIRIMRANQPNSQTLESMFFWLAQLQESKNLNSQALVTYDEFMKVFPDSEYAPQALFLKGKLYEKLNLKPQAMKIYSDIRKSYPHSRERHFAEMKLGNEIKPKTSKTN